MSVWAIPLVSGRMIFWWTLRRFHFYTISALSLIPQLNLKQGDTEFELTADLAGIELNDVRVTVDKGILTVQAKKSVTERKVFEKYHFIERKHGVLSRSIKVLFNSCLVVWINYLYIGFYSVASWKRQFWWCPGGVWQRCFDDSHRENSFIAKREEHWNKPKRIWKRESMTSFLC